MEAMTEPHEEKRAARIDRIVGDVLAGRHLKATPSDATDHEAIRVAAALAGSREGYPRMSPAFRRRLTQMLQKGEAPAWISRRSALVEGLGLAAGAVGVNLEDGTPRGSAPPVETLRTLLGDGFYICYFQQQGVADAELDRDPRATFRRLLSAASGDSAPAGLPVIPPGGGFLDLCPEPAELPGWLTERDVDAFVAEYAGSGFSGPLNWYRCMDLSWELMAAWKHAAVTVPAAFLAGDKDLTVSFLGGQAVLDNLRGVVPELREARMLPGCGHWTQQERPDEVTETMISFLRGLG